MSMLLVQSNPGGSASANLVGAHQTLTTSAAGFLNNTTAGNLLVCITWATASGAGCSTPIPPATPVTAGLTWVIGAISSTFFTSSPRASGQVIIWIAAGAPSILPSDTTTFQIESSTSSGTNSFAVEFALLEFSGVKQTSPRDISLSPFNRTGGTPGIAITTTDVDLVLTALIANPATGSNLTAGAGFTLGPNATLATIGQVQYQLDVPTGVVQSFFTGTEPSWGAVSASFFPTPPQPILQVAPLTLSYSGVEGGVSPVDQTIAVANGNGGTLSWTVASDQAWLTALPVSGTNAGVVTATVDITGITAGVYTGHLTFTAAGATGSPQVVVVTLTVAPSATDLSVSPTVLNYTAIVGEANPADRIVTVSNVGTPAAMDFTTAHGATWLAVDPFQDNAGLAPVVLTVSVDTTGLVAGTYNDLIVVTAVGALDSPQSITVTLDLSNPPPPVVTPVVTSSVALTQTDTWQLDNAMLEWPTDAGTPIAWHENTLPQQQLAIAPTPDDVGQLGLLYIAFTEILDGSGIALSIPDDWAPYIVWGALSELLSSDGPAYDPVRAQYCDQRFHEGIELARLVLGG